jgi:hypothetical protein
LHADEGAGRRGRPTGRSGRPGRAPRTRPPRALA